MSVDKGKLHFTLGVAPTSQLTLTKDLQMLKVALLYADSVKLCSVTTSIILQVAAIGELTDKQRVDFLEQLLPVIAGDGNAIEVQGAIQEYKRIQHKKYRNTQEIMYQRRLAKIISQTWDGSGGMRETAYKIAHEAGAEGIVQAFELGLLDIHIFDTSRATVVEDFFDVVSAAVAEKTTYPLFDDFTGNLIQAGLKESKLVATAGDLGRSKHSGLVGNLLSRLPLFEQASVDEVIDIRRELEHPLTRFRSAIVQFSDNIRGAQWDEDFSTEAERIFYQVVDPAILEIEEAVRGNRYLQRLLGQYTSETLKALATSGAVGYGLGMLVSPLSSLPQIVSTALPIGLTAAAIANKTYQEWKTDQQKIEQNQLYFCYQAKEQLKKG